MKASDGYDKLRGGYYTPATISKFIAEWAIRDKSSVVLEPSCGDGSFISAALNRFKELGADSINDSITGVEFDSDEAKKASAYGVGVIVGDFFTFFKEQISGKVKYDVVIGNPPFIRYQNFDETMRKIAFESMNRYGFHPNKMTNIWIPFLLLSCKSLNENGRIGMVIPAELFQVDYAAEARCFMSEFFDALTIVTFKQLVFSNIQQEVVLLLGEVTSSRKGIRIVELNSLEDIESEWLSCLNRAENKELDHDTEKWVKYYLSGDELNLLRKLGKDERITSTEQLFTVNVGVVSGENDFFVVNKDVSEAYGIEKSTLSIVSRSSHVSGILFDGKDMDGLITAGKRVFLFSPKESENGIRSDDRKYIEYGESRGFHKNFKCRVRDKWYIVPLSWKPEAFVIRQANHYPRMIMNYTDAAVTDTLHKVRFNEGIDGREVSAAFINSYTLALSETIGRSYGGGVLTFEPGEIRKLRIPLFCADELDIDKIDDWQRSGSIWSILEYTDSILLKKGLGLSDMEVEALRGIWIKMRNRRLDRRKSAKRVLKGGSDQGQR